jgi:hypothetical protein
MIKSASAFSQTPIKVDLNGRTVWYVRKFGDENTVQFLEPVERGRYKELCKPVSYKFYQYVWEKVLSLSEWGTGSNRWYECVDFICNKSEQFEMAWMMFTLEGENDKSKGRKRNKTKSPAKRGQSNKP